MMPVGKEIYNNSQNEIPFNNVASVVNFVGTGACEWIINHVDKMFWAELVSFFEKIQKVNSSEDREE